VRTDYKYRTIPGREIGVGSFGKRLCARRPRPVRAGGAGAAREIRALYFFDPMYFVYVGPAILLAAWAQWKVKSAYANASRMPASSGLTGAGAAQRILNAYGVADVAIEPVRSFLGDHYDPRRKVLRLSPDVYHGRSLASVGIAAHEVGHAIQDAQAYAPLAIRNGLVPMASIGSQLSMAMLMVGLILAYMRIGLGQPIAVIGLGLFAVVVLFQLINLPVEFNASSRAKTILVSQGIIAPTEQRAVGKVLSAAAMTYVAATIVAIMQMLYFASLIFGRRD
jgi:Zn-dependent membrane protease YugP